jgi:hypothetical protein
LLAVVVAKLADSALSHPLSTCSAGGVAGERLGRGGELALPGRDHRRAKRMMVVMMKKRRWLSIAGLTRSERLEVDEWRLLIIR